MPLVQAPIQLRNERRPICTVSPYQIPNGQELQAPVTRFAVADPGLRQSDGLPA